MTKSANSSQPQIPEPWQPRFTLRTMFLVTLVFSVMAAAGAYVLPSSGVTHSARMAYTFFTLAAPLLLVMVVSLVRQFLVWLGRRK